MLFVEADGPGRLVEGAAQGQEGAVARIEKSILNAPVVQDIDGLVQGVAFAYGAEVEDKG